MKCLSLWQPWASLVAFGYKSVETRDPYAKRWSGLRGPLLIHAAKHWTRDEQDAWREFRSASSMIATMPEELPLGAIVAVARVSDVRVMHARWINEQSSLERMLGGWDVGRVGIVFDRVMRLDSSIPCRGHQGIFGVRREDVGENYARLVAAWDFAKGAA